MKWEGDCLASRIHENKNTEFDLNLPTISTIENCYNEVFQ